MAKFTGKNIVFILKRTLNLLNYRIVDHGERVAYIMLKMLECKGGYTAAQLQGIFFASLMHDIGAFKTNDTDVFANPSYMLFELKDTMHHAAYGYLFLKSFDFLDDYADAILHHHTKYQDLLQATDCKNQDIAAMLFVADRADMLANMAGKPLDKGFLQEYRDTVFSSEALDLLLEAETRFNLSRKLQTGAYIEEMLAYYDTVQLTEAQSSNCLCAIAYAIDFRSEFTVTHTITTMAISIQIAEIMALSPDEQEDVFFGALLHDMGKIATSLLVLEKATALSDYEYLIMKDHVQVTRTILEGCLSDEILQIAIRHHEKLDGTGYPGGLMGDVLTTPQRIVAIADILSALKNKRSYKKAFPKEVIVNILQEQLHAGKLCPQVIQAVLDNYDSIMHGADEHCALVLDSYETMHNQYTAYLQA